MIKAQVQKATRRFRDDPNSSHSPAASMGNGWQARGARNVGNLSRSTPGYAASVTRDGLIDR